jgi:hypothetical protein
MLPEDEFRYIPTRGYYASGTFAGSGSMAESVSQVYRVGVVNVFPCPMFLPAIINNAQP